MKKRLRIAIYSRKSKYSDKGDSIGNQIELTKEYIKKNYPENEYEIQTTIFEDEGFSGGNIERPQFRKFLEEEKEKPYDILISYRLDRISRNIADFASLMNELNKQNTSFISIKEQFDTTIPMGRAMMYIASVFAQLEREVIAERIRDNMLELAKTGRWLGGDTPLGFNSEKVEIMPIAEENINSNMIQNKNKKSYKLKVNEEEKQKVQLIFKKYLEYKSLAGLEYYLLKNKVYTRKGKEFRKYSLKNILTNPVYSQNDDVILKYFKNRGQNIYAEQDGREKFNGKYGIIAYNKTDNNKKDRPLKDWIIAVGLHKGYVTGKVWVQVQELLEKNKDKSYRASANNTNETIFSGILRCKRCGNKMIPKSNRQNKNGTTTYYYVCREKDRTKRINCNSHNIKGNELDDNFIKILKDIFVPNSEVYQELKNMAFNHNPKEDITEKMETLKKEYEKNEKEIKDLAEKVKYIDISVIDIVNQELIKAQNKKEELENKIDILEHSKSENKKLNTKLSKGEKYILNIIDDCFDILETFDLKAKKDILNLLIESAYGEADIIEINLLNTKIAENQKKILCSQSFVNCCNILHLSKEKTNNIMLSSEKGSRCSYDSSVSKSV
ncbi:MAG: recombinase family protein [Clostridia bacterium]|nr:recombinase family protein [Clostridia bacterium]